MEFLFATPYATVWSRRYRIIGRRGKRLSLNEIGMGGWVVAFGCERVAQATGIAVQIVRKPPDQQGFAIHARRRAVKGCRAWRGRNRRLAKDFEATIGSAAAFLYAATAMPLIGRLARST